MTIPFPEAQPNQLLDPKEIEDHIERLKVGDVSEAYLLAYDTATYHIDDEDILRERLELLLPHFDELSISTLVIIATLMVKLGDYDKAFSIVDSLMSWGKISAGRTIFLTLKDEDQDWLVEKGLDYLKQSADAGFMLARRSQMSWRMKEFGFVGKVYGVFWRICMIPRTTYILIQDKDDPRVADGLYEGEDQINRLYMKLGTFWKTTPPKNLGDKTGNSDR